MWTLCDIISFSKQIDGFSKISTLNDRQFTLLMSKNIDLNREIIKFSRWNASISHELHGNAAFEMFKSTQIKRHVDLLNIKMDNFWLRIKTLMLININELWV